MIVLLYSTVCLSLGLLLLRLLAPPNLPTPEKIVIAFLMGQITLGLIWQIIAVQGWFTQSAILAISAFWLLLGGKSTFLEARHLVAMTTHSLRTLWQSETLAWQSLMALTVALIALFGIISLSPDLNADALFLYLVTPKLLAETNHLVIVSGYESHFQLTMLGEFHFGALMLIGGQTTFFIWPISIAVALMTMFLAKTLGMGQRGQWMILMAIFTSSAYTFLIGTGKVDLFGTGLAIAAFYWFFHRQLHLVGLCMGFSIAAKFTYSVFMPPCIAILLLFHTPQNLPWPTRLLKYSFTLLSVGLWAALPAIAQVWKNIALFNQPFAPLFGVEQPYDLDEGWFSSETTRRLLLTYPFALTYGNYAAQMGNLSALVLAFLPFSIRHWNGKTRQLLSAVLIGLLLWLLFVPHIFAPRYLLPLLLAWIVLVAFGAEKIYLTPSKTLPILVTATCAIVLLASLYLALPKAVNALYRVANPHQPCHFDHNANTTRCQIQHLLNATAPHGARVFAHTRATYWLRPDLIQCVSQSAEKLTFRHTGDWAFLAERGFRYVMVDKFIRPPFGPVTPPAWMTVETLYEDELGVLYRLEVQNPPTAPVATCQPTSNKRWQVEEN